MQCDGQFTTAMTHCNKSIEHTSNLLGRQAACEMGLVARLEEVEDELFGDIGLFKCEPVRIQLYENAQPYCINTARKIAFPSRS